MLDENLPTFIVGAPTERSKLDATISYTQHGAELTPSYTLRKPDPASPDSKNRYAVALYDSFSPEILYAEILLIPEWSQPSLSAEQIRLNGGVPPPPEPILPTEFVIQLYNPDQQVLVHQKKASKFGSNLTWYFDMPQQSFRQPSSSALDRTQHDPAASDVTPKIGFKWKKDSRLSKDLACFLSGKSTNPDGTKKRSKEPDITIAIFQHLREMTIYEPNLQRVEVEDSKGFEVVLLLGAVAIRDIYFGRMNETFNITELPKPTPNTTASKPAPTGYVRPTGTHVQIPTRKQTPSSQAAAVPSRVPPTDPRSQWEIDVETARLKKMAEAEERARLRREEEEQKQIQRMLEEEERERRRKQADVEKETQRLKKLYGKDQAKVEATLRPPSLPTRQHRHSSPQIPMIPEGTVPYAPPPPQQGYHSHSHSHASSFTPPPGAFQPYVGGPYIQGPAAASQSTFFGNPGQAGPSRLKEKKSFFGFNRTRSGDLDAGNPYTLSPNAAGSNSRLTKKKSSMF